MADPFLPVPNTLQVEAVYFTHGGFAENVYHVHGTGPFTDLPGLAQSVADVIVSWETASMRGLRSGDMGLHHTVVRDMGEQGGFALYDPRVVVASRVSPPLPDNCTIAMRWTTGRAGRSYRGRTYHIGLTQDMVENDAVTGPNVTALITGYRDLMTRIQAIAGFGAPFESAGLSIVSKRHNNVQRGTAEVTTITDVGVADSFVDSQRRRLMGRGS